jgi:hypothetical protein
MPGPVHPATATHKFKPPVTPAAPLRASAAALIDWIKMDRPRSAFLRDLYPIAQVSESAWIGLAISAFILLASILLLNFRPRQAKLAILCIAHAR